MIDRQRLLDDLKPILKVLEADLRERSDAVPEITERMDTEYEQAVEANRTGVSFEAWRADLITQVAVAWVLSCVFVRFLEDNTLIAPSRISGPLHGAGTDAGLQRARDERDHYFQKHPKQTDRDYLLSIFDDLAKLPGIKDVFGPHNPALAETYRNWLSGDAAQKLIEYFQKIDADGTGELIHDFTDVNWDTRFLGDLYQDLSEAARKKYALLQTPIFIEEFILERTLEPAINEFGLQDFKMIDPACGSGHFLLGAFARILEHWRKAEPGTNERELVNRALASVHGVDLNPYAVAIARFRLLLLAMSECHITKLSDAPNLRFNLACGDSLLHGSPRTEQQVMGFHDLAHHYQSEAIDELRRILTPGRYHAVVANPPYITVKDKALNKAYRDHYPQVCHMKYSLSVPFMQRLVDLSCTNGFTGQITANSFMKREFGKKLIENYLPTWDLTHVIDTAGAYIPGHGTPTVILFGRSRKPVAPTIRTAMGITGEPATPDDPAHGLVWTAIVDQLNQPGSQSLYISVNDSPRDAFHKHPWSIGGGGASELKEMLDASAATKFQTMVDSMGFMSITGEDDAFVATPHFFQRGKVPSRGFGIGDGVRDWLTQPDERIVFMYDIEGPTTSVIALGKLGQYANNAWVFRTNLKNRLMFGKLPEESGLSWYEYRFLSHDKLRTTLSIVFGFVATHNHFVLDRGGMVFNRSAPVIKLPVNATEDDHLALIGLLNSSTAGFWLKQVSQNKGSTVDQHGARQRTAPFEDFWEFTSTKLETFPLPVDRPLDLARRVDAMAGVYAESLPEAVCRRTVPDAAVLALAREQARRLRGEMIALQEELDWQCYGLYGLLSDADAQGVCQDIDSPTEGLGVPAIALGQRAFEIVLARQMAAGEVETTWFTRHGSTPITEIPSDWPADYQAMVQTRIDLISGGASDKNIGLIEKPEYKRRWNTEPWDKQQERALRGWLLDRLESYFDLDGRMNEVKQVTAKGELHQPRLTSIAKVADLARADKNFMQVAEIYADRMDFDIGALVSDLVAAENVPALPVLRYKPKGMDKRAAWERTWELQRLEDELARQREAARHAITAAEKAACDPIASELAEISKLSDELSEAERSFRDQHFGTQQRELSLSLEQDYLLNAKTRTDEGTRAAIKLGKLQSHLKAKSKQAELQKDRLISESKAVLEARAALRAIPKDPDIAVPPKYTSADFISTGGARYWSLRGKLDVPKERWVSFPHCEGEDGTLVIAWAGYDHLQLARAIAERYELAKEQQGLKLVPLLTAIGQLIPWLKQWHNEVDPTFSMRMGDYFENYLAEEAKAIGQSVEQVMAWMPPAKARGRGRKKKVKV